MIILGYLYYIVGSTCSSLTVYVILPSPLKSSLLVQKHGRPWVCRVLASHTSVHYGRLRPAQKQKQRVLKCMINAHVIGYESNRKYFNQQYTNRFACMSRSPVHFVVHVCLAGFMLFFPWRTVMCRAL